MSDNQELGALEQYLIEEVTERVISRISSGPLTISKAASAELAELAKQGGITGICSIGYGPFPLSLRYRINPDGTLWLELCDMTNCRMWEGTLKGPGK